MQSAWSICSDTGQPVERDVVLLVEEFRDALARRLAPMHYELVELELELCRQLHVHAAGDQSAGRLPVQRGKR